MSKKFVRKMLRRFSAMRPTTKAVVATMPMAACRTFFGKGWDNASLDIVFKGVLRKPEVNDYLRTYYVRECLANREIDDYHQSRDYVENIGSQHRVFLPPHLGDAHRVLKGYSLTAYPILDEKGEQLVVDVDGQHLPAFADPDDDYAKICLPQKELMEFLAIELLKALKWEPSARGAAGLLESLYRGAELPDHVFQTPAVIERF